MVLATAVPAAYSCTVLLLPNCVNCEVYLKSSQHVCHNVAHGSWNASV